MNLLDLDARWRRFTDPDYRCPCCGMEMPGIYDLGYDAPDDWTHGPIPEGAEDLSVGADRLSPDLCKIGEDRFLRAVLHLPIRGSDETLAIGAWAAVPPDLFYAYIDHCVDGAAFTGGTALLANQIPTLADEPEAGDLTAGTGAERPRLTAQDGDLAEAQTDGLSFDALLDLYAACGNDLRPHLTGTA
ncbi:DUF2199 domain-containing protein [Pseudoprimorskyibacter insulae]|uniref:DUF2199 domain-containing protein n=1 Tax=Pseudoprimorskyibacter insulae TaxID=1695997 RepID=A0A2R8AWX1_9RHOB|nr:DUF2199 domain-containing protein [Pseudoprimorskyibacter insulae]SPF80512.1 hypothetical protein PRI8871_02322 [Pseudoprimorskyibacter insulae]